MSKKISLICLNCKKEYFVLPYRKNKSDFCSKSCNAKYHYKDSLGKIDHSHLIGNKHRKGIPASNPYKKGHIPWNKGKRGLHLSPKTEFKKGQKPLNLLEIGTISLRKDKHNKIRQFIKISGNKWEEYAKYQYKKYIGEIRKGNIIHHKDFDCLNDNPDNLEQLTRAEHINKHRQQMRELKCKVCGVEISGSFIDDIGKLCFNCARISV